MKKLVSLLLVLLMCLALLPTAALAEGEGSVDPESVPASESLEEPETEMQISEEDAVAAANLDLSECTEYKTLGYLKLTTDTNLKELPYADADTIHAIKTDQNAVMTCYGVWKNKYGNYWYKVEANWKDLLGNLKSGTGYIFGDKATWSTAIPMSDISISDFVAPTKINVGNSFHIKGTIKTDIYTIKAVYAYVFKGYDTVSGSAAISSKETGLSKKTYSLYNSTVDKKLSFGKLAVGKYTYVIKIDFAYYYTANGKELNTGTFSEWRVYEKNFDVVDPSAGAMPTVTFNANGGNVSPTSKTVTYGSTYGELPTPTRTGYSFDGWYTSSDGGSKVTTSTTVTNASDHTLYAHWIANTYTVWYNANGGSVSASSKTVTYGSAYGTLPTPTRTGYIFDGWYTAASGGSVVKSSTIMSTAADHTLYAQWTHDNRITVTLNANAEGVSVSPDAKLVAPGSLYGDLPTPTCNGFTFTGWFTAKSGGTQVTATTVVTTTTNHTLYAHWKPNSYTVTFNVNASSGSVSPTSKKVFYHKTYGELPTPTCKGYTFTGWFTDKSGGTQVTSSTKVTRFRNHALYAHWKKKTAHDIDGTIKFSKDDVEFKGTTPYVIWNYDKHEPGFTVVDDKGKTIDPKYYSYEYKENKRPGTGYVFVTFKNGYSGSCNAFFKIYLPATTATTVKNVADGIKLTWEPVEDAAGYVIYRRAWNLVDAGWTDFVRWNNTTDLEWTDTKVYAGTRYQYGVKAYFTRRTDPVSGVQIGGNVGDNFNLGMVGPLKTTVRITTRKLTKLTPGTQQATAKWEGSKLFTGYELQIARNSAFTQGLKTVRIKNASTVSKTIKKLTSGKKYYVRVRSYHIFDGTTYYGQWSNVKNCTVK